MGQKCLLDVFDFGLSRDKLMQKLLAEKIDSRPFFMPMHKQKSLCEYGCNCSGNYPVADEISRKGLYLPSSSSLTEEEIDYICDMLKSQTSIRIAG
jgi:perosamine synthetase